MNAAPCPIGVALVVFIVLVLTLFWPPSGIVPDNCVTSGARREPSPCYRLYGQFATGFGYACFRRRRHAR